MNRMRVGLEYMFMGLKLLTAAGGGLLGFMHWAAWHETMHILVR